MSNNIIAPTAPFGFNLLRKCVREGKDQNFVASPLGLYCDLALVARGAYGQALAQINEVLGLPADGTGVDSAEACEQLIKATTGDDLGVTLKMANSIWVAENQGFGLKASYVETARRHFDAEVFAENFSDSDTVKKMARWISEKTNAQIESIVDEIGPDIVMFLFNALDFKGKFRRQFDKTETRSATFKAPSGDVAVRMMHSSGDTRYTENEDYEMVVLPFGEAKGRFALSVLLPREGKTISQVVQGLTANSFEQSLKQAEETEVELYLPKFELECESTMNKVLMELGMPDAFDAGKADFSRMAHGNLFISEVKHKVRMRVDEEGAEAAAATSVSMGLESMSTAAMFYANRPFVTIIADEATNTVVIAGVINKPEAPKD